MWSKTDSYYGKPFLWCMLHNYGDVRAIYGNLSRVATGPVEARGTPGNTMIGTGITAEGIETNPVIYDLMVGEIIQQLQFAQFVGIIMYSHVLL